METNEKIKKKRIIKIIIPVILTATLIALVGFAYARYVISKSGQTQAQIAKWNFKVSDGITHTQNIDNLSITRTDSNTEVQSGTIAPGTYGKFQIDVDATRNRN